MLYILKLHCFKKYFFYLTFMFNEMFKTIPQTKMDQRVVSINMDHDTIMPHLYGPHVHNLIQITLCTM
jgi:hypothetical protein